jgi:F-type H+-transporting ATPase subunit b
MEYKPMIDISADVIFTIINFLILLVILYKILYKPVTAMMAKREEEIRNAVTGASAEREAALQMKAEYEKMLANARGEAQQIMNRAHQQGEKIVQDAHEKAENDAQQIIVRAQQEILTEKEQTFQQLKGEIVELAIAAAEKLIGDRMDSETNRRLVNEFIQSRGDN